MPLILEGEVVLYWQQWTTSGYNGWGAFWTRYTRSISHLSHQLVGNTWAMDQSFHIYNCRPHRSYEKVMFSVMSLCSQGIPCKDYPWCIGPHHTGPSLCTGLHQHPGGTSKNSDICDSIKSLWYWKWMVVNGKKII